MRLAQFVRGALLMVAILVGTEAQATNGYFLHGQGTASKGMGGTGVALGLDSLSGATNPGVLVLVPPETYLSISLFHPVRSYTVEGEASGYPGTMGLAPGRVESGSELFVMPSVAVHATRGRNAFGLSLISHGGMNTDYPVSTFHGSTAGVDLSQAFVNVSWSRRLSERHSAGITGVIVYQRFEATGLEAFAPMSARPDSLTNNGYEDSWGFGLRLGYHGQLTRALAVGAAWSPRIAMTKLDRYAGLFCDEGGFDIPESWTVGLAYEASEGLLLLFDVQRIDYSEVDSVGHKLLPNLLEAPLGDAGGPGFGWQDMTIYKGGVQWSPRRDWTFRAGYSTGNQPIPDSEVLFNILAPGVIEEHVTVGFTHVLPSARKVNVALTYAIENTVRGQNPLEAPGQQMIELTMDEWELDLGFSF